MRNVLILLFSLFFFGCSSSYVSKQQTVTIAQGVQFQLIKEHPFEGGIELLQSAQVNFKGESHDLLFQTEVTAQKLVMFGLSATGTRLFSIQLSGEQITASGLPTEDGLKAEYLLADMQLCLWSLSAINQSLSGARLIQQSPGKRVMVRNGLEIISIEYSDTELYKGQIHFQHLERDYSLLIEPLSIEETQHDPE